MATYGSIPGVQITTSSGTLTGVTIGREQHLVLVGVGNDESTVAPNDPTSIDGRADVDEKFGANSDVAIAYRNAIDNGMNPEYVIGIRAETTETTDTFSDSMGTLADAPLIPDSSRISASETGSGETLDVQFRYEDPPDSPESESVVYINPITGGFDTTVSATVDEVEIVYEWADWTTAIDAVDDAIVEAEFGVVAPLTTATSVVEHLNTVVTEMRKEMKMVLGIAGAQPNGTESNIPHLDTESYTHEFNSDSLFVVGPTAHEGRTYTDADYEFGALGSISGLFAGTDTTDPVYDDTISTDPLTQGLSRSELTDLRESYTIPIRDIGTPRVMDNLSTYDQETEGGWERDYFRRRIVDVVILTLYQIARVQIGAVLDGDTIEDVNDAIDNQIDSFVDDGLLQPGEQEFAVSRADDRTIGVDATISPYGVAKSAEIDLEVNA